MAKINSASALRASNVFGGQINNLFNLKSFNELKKDQTNIKIFKNSSFDSSFNSIQSLNTNLSQLMLLPSTNSNGGSQSLNRQDSIGCPSLPAYGGGRGGATHKVALEGRNTKNIKKNKYSAILRAIRSIRLNRDEWKLIRYINLIGKKIRSIPFFCPLPLPTAGRLPAQSLDISKGFSNPTPAVGRVGGSLHRGRPDRNKLKKNFLNLDKIKKLASENPCLDRFPPLPTAPTAGAPTKAPTPPYNLYLDTNKDIRGEGNKYFYIKQNNKIFSNNNIINKNILLRNMKYNFLKSTLSSILKKKIRTISEVLEDKPIKNYILYSYLKNCISSLSSLRLGTPNHLNIPALGPLAFGASAPSPAVGAVGAVGKGRGPKAGVNPSLWQETGGGRNKLSLNKYKGRKLGSFINYNKIIGYKFSSTFYQVNKFGLEKNRGNIYIKDTYKLLFYLFKSMYCLISKPVLKYSNDKVTIQLFYYLNIPKKKVFRFFSIFYINSIKKKWLALIEKKKTGESYPPALAGPKAGLISKKIGGVRDPKIYIRWKLRKAISRLKNKIIPCASDSKPKGSWAGCVLPPSEAVGVGGAGSLLSRSWRKQGQKNLLFKLRKFNLTAKAVYQKKFKLICAILSNKFNKPVELQLIRLHHPYHDSNILVNLLSLNIKNKRKKARVAVQKIYNKKPVKNLNDPNLNYPPALAGPKASLEKQGVIIAPTALGPLPTAGVASQGGKFIPAFLSGLNIKIAGRLMREPIIPRITTKIFGKGASAIGKVNYLDVARITKKNRKGAYTIKITSGQNFF